VSKKIFIIAKKILPIIGLIILAYLVYTLDLEKIKEGILSIHPIYIMIILSLSIPNLLIRNTMWRMILKEQKIKIGFWKSLKVFLIGFFYSSITPGYYSHLMRIPYLKEKTNEPYGKLFVNTIIEAALISLSLYILIIFGMLVFFNRFSQTFFPILLIIVITLIAYFFVFIAFKSKKRGEKILYFLIKLFTPRKIRGNAKLFISTFYKNFPRIRSLILPFILCYGVWFFLFTQEYIIVLALGVDVPYHYFLILFPIANAVGYIPITVAGLGTREFTAILIFTSLFAVSKEEIFIISLLGYLFTSIFIGFIGFLLSLTEAKPKKLDHFFSK
jgi:hypothetical protein